MTKKENERIVIVMALDGNIESANSVDTGTARKVREIIGHPQKCVPKSEIFNDPSMLKVTKLLGTPKPTPTARSNHQGNPCYTVVCDWTGCRLLPIPCPIV